jgi:hypothetical protein
MLVLTQGAGHSPIYRFNQLSSQKGTPPSSQLWVTGSCRPSTSHSWTSFPAGTQCPFPVHLNKHCTPTANSTARTPPMPSTGQRQCPWAQVYPAGSEFHLHNSCSLAFGQNTPIPFAGSKSECCVVKHNLPGVLSQFMTLIGDHHDLDMTHHWAFLRHFTSPSHFLLHI